MKQFKEDYLYAVNASPWRDHCKYLRHHVYQLVGSIIFIAVLHYI